MKKLIALLCFAMIAALPASAQNRSNAENRCDLDIHSEVPEFIEAGLSNGSMERVGGVIRNTDNQKTIAWLRQGGQIGQVAESSAGLLEHVTRLSGFGNLPITRFLAGVTPFLNISMAGFSLLEHILGIRAHEAELERIYDRISEEFQRDREVKLTAALDYADNIILANNESYRLDAVKLATFQLGEARLQLLRDLEELLLAERNQETIELAMNYQVLAMKVCSMSARLHLEIGEEDVALDRVSKCVSEQENYTRRFVNKSLGDNPALYFHESVSDENLERYLDIERWLRGKRDVLTDVIKAYRGSFWEDDATKALFTSGRVNRQLLDNPFYLQSLPQAEILIENFQRLKGYELELSSMCRPTFTEWESYDGDGSLSISEHDGYVMLVNHALLDSKTAASQ